MKRRPISVRGRKTRRLIAGAGFGDNEAQTDIGQRGTKK
jgi:hypothetical protein